MAVELPVEVGQVLSGKFRVERLLGVGGMGVVLEATHLQLQERVALKFLLPHATKDKSAVARFEREARAAVKLKNEHVVRVMDVGTMEDGAPYMVMELLEGRDLAQVIKDLGRLPVAMAIEYFTQICDAVGEAHALGIVHRDLKPENVFVTQKSNGTPVLKVLDFGISKMSGEALSLTNTTQVMGSPYYMSPEQLRASKDVDQRSDIWSLGAIFYEMLTGRVPFEAETLMELCTQVIENTPSPISTVRNDVPPEVLRVVDGCLAKDRAQRFASIAAVMSSFEPTVVATGQFTLPAATRVFPPDASPNAHRISGATNTSWNNTSIGHAQGARRRQLLIGGGIGAGALVLFGVVLANVLGQHKTEGAQVEGIAPSATAAASASTPSTLPNVAPTPSVSATIAASSTNTPLATTIAKPTSKPDAGAINKPITAPVVSAKPKPKPDDDIPTVRR